jgi:hypothetical protein
MPPPESLQDTFVQSGSFGPSSSAACADKESRYDVVDVVTLDMVCNEDDREKLTLTFTLVPESSSVSSMRIEMPVVSYHFSNYVLYLLTRSSTEGCTTLMCFVAKARNGSQRQRGLCLPLHLERELVGRPKGCQGESVTHHFFVSYSTLWLKAHENAGTKQWTTFLSRGV